MAAFGGLLGGAQAEFKHNIDVKAGGVITALPALLANGLLSFSKDYFLPMKGYYNLTHLFLTFSFMALLRLKSIEHVRYWDPGEFGKIIGIDRIPEVKTLRKKIKTLAETGELKKWTKALSTHWMKNNPEQAGVLYIDGHVRVYSGKKTKLPKRYVSREKLCLSGVTDYWINDAIGRPYFVINKVVNEGMLSVIRHDIVPRLLEDIPHQLSDELFKTNPYLIRCEMVFDREGYSPSFFKEMWQTYRIACTTYRKYSTNKWSSDEFLETVVHMPNGEKTTMKLAERGVRLSGSFWVREIRKLSTCGHQTAIITTNFKDPMSGIAAHMFPRWSQELFFKYMMEHYHIDRLVSHQLIEPDENIVVVNPEYRTIDSKIRSLNSKLIRRKANFASIQMDEEISTDKLKRHVYKMTELKEYITTLERRIAKLKLQRKSIKKHITVSQLPTPFKIFKPHQKLFLDTIKMIAYRSETALVSILREKMDKSEEARALVRQLFQTDVDMIPDYENNFLTIRLHNLTCHRNNQYMDFLCNVLNESKTIFPGTNLTLFFESVSK